VHRLNQIILIGSTALGCWLGMQAVHEFGHVLGAWLTGATIVRVVLHPLTISRTDLAGNPHPLVVAWAGPVMGVAIPLLFWMIAAAKRLSGAFVVRFFAGFCMIANGLYIGLGSFGHVGDCGDMLRHGSEQWHLWLFGVLAAPLGLWLWHGIGPHFGLGHHKRPVSSSIAFTAFAACLALAVLGLLLSATR
jgi:Peptidase M50B-like